VFGVVLDQHEATARSQQASDEHQDRRLVTNEVERVGHHHAVEDWQVEGHGEIPDVLVKGGGWEPAMDGLRLPPDRRGIAIDGVDDARRPEQVGKGEREGAGTRAKVSPDLSSALDAAADQSHVVVVVHRPPSMPLRGRRPGAGSPADCDPLTRPELRICSRERETEGLDGRRDPALGSRAGDGLPRDRS
jgi:hypothetical protein